MKFLPYESHTKSIAIGRGKVTGTFEDMPGCMSPGVALILHIPVTNGNLVDTDYDLRLARPQIRCRLKVEGFKHEPFRWNRADSIMRDSVLKLNQYASDLEDDRSNLVSIGAGETLDVELPILLMYTDRRRNDGRDNLIPVDWLEQWGIDIDNIMEGQDAGLTTTTPLSVDVVVLHTRESESMEIGVPCYLEDGDLTDGLERWPTETWLTDFVLTGSDVAVADLATRDFTMRINGNTVFEETNAGLIHDTGMIGVDADYQLDGDTSLVLFSQGKGYQAADLIRDCNVLLNKREGGAYPADSRYQYSGILNRTVKVVETLHRVELSDNVKTGMKTFAGTVAKSAIPERLRTILPVTFKAATGTKLRSLKGVGG